MGTSTVATIFMSKRGVLCLTTLTRTSHGTLISFVQLSFSPTTPTATYVKIIALLIGILFSCGGLLMVCAIVGWQLGFSYFAFLSSQVWVCGGSVYVHVGSGECEGLHLSLFAV